jgi:hypothetical protein
MQQLALRHVLLDIGTGHDDHWNILQAIVLLHLLQDFDAVALGEQQVE